MAANSEPQNQSQNELAAELELGKEIERQISPLVSGEAKNQVISRVTAILMAEKFSGPIPHPRHLAQYDKIIPNGADLILKMAEKQQDHEIRSSSRVTSANIVYPFLGLLIGWSIPAALVAAAIYFGSTQNFTAMQYSLGAAVCTGAIGLVRQFIQGREPK